MSSLHTSVFAENAGPVTRGQAKSLVGGPVVGARRRRALGEISNNVENPGAKVGKGTKAPRYAPLVAPQPTLQLPEMDAHEPAAAAAAPAPVVAAVVAAETLGPVDIEVDSPEADWATARAAELGLDPMDAGDVDDAQAVVEYIPEIMDHLFATEVRRMPRANYLSMHQDINQRMRVILLNWIAEVALKFKCVKETLYLAVNVIDRFLQRRAVSRQKLQLVGATALLIASKIEDQWAPLIEDIVYIAANAYTRADVLAMEVQILATLKFNLTVPYACTFADRFGKVCGLSREDMFVVDFLCELQLQYYNMIKYTPSNVAASAVYLTRRLTGQPIEWSSRIEEHLRYTEEELLPCARDLLALLRMDEPKYTAVRKKFSSSKYGRAAFIEHEHLQL